MATNGADAENMRNYQRAVLTTLQSIDASLKALLLTMSQSRASSPSAPTVNIDDKFGNPKLRFLPRDWTGSGEFKGILFSECPPELLDLAADSLDYFASKNEDAKKAGYDRLDASRARAWAARLRAGWTAPKPDRVDETHGEPTW